jgi:alkanesulfonate monooxygenase SsuD/methylene tetrahydromethanopterin reductase-like flavin-dependent oxidoreductase (luciferase family)
VLSCPCVSTQISPQFGFFLVPEAASYPDLVRQAVAADRAGLDLIGIQDHPYQRRYLDTFSLIADLLARTERIRIFPDVANLPLRGPAMLAKTAVSLDLMSGGRFELGLGAGGFLDAAAAMGAPRRGPGEAVRALEEGVEIIRGAWSGARSLTYGGRHHSVAGYHPGPVPEREIGIWIGAVKPRMLRLTGRLGDGWLPSFPYVGPDAAPGMVREIEEGAAEAGRDPGAIRRIWNLGGLITDGPAAGLLQGPPDHWIEALTGFATELGFDSFVFWPSEDPLRQLERFAQEVAPGVREALAAIERS